MTKETLEKMNVVIGGRLVPMKEWQEMKKSGQISPLYKRDFFGNQMNEQNDRA